jgi:PAS domain-containing protein
MLFEKLPNWAGMIRYGFWRASYRAAGARVVGINVAAEEITERKRAQAALLANEEQLRELADTLAARVAIQKSSIQTTAPPRVSTPRMKWLVEAEIAAEQL